MKKSLVYIVIIVICLVGCHKKYPFEQSKTQSVRAIQDINSNATIKKLNSLPTYNPNKYSGWQVDLRSVDISSLDLGDRESDLMNSDFDTLTKWSAKLPKNFNPEKILEAAKDPGLNIASLHKEGITGKGVNVAIIDGWLLENQDEFTDRLKMYMSINNDVTYAPKQFHGTAVASIAIGKTTGVAPEANLYYFSSNNTNSSNEADFTSYAKAIEQIIEVNKSLPKDNKVRVLSISSGWTPECKGYTEITNAIRKASNGGIFVISSNLFETYSYKFYYQGLTIDDLSNRNVVSNYKVVPWTKWISMSKNSTGFDKYYEDNFNKKTPEEQLLIPIGCKTVASQLGQKEYTFFSTSGWSWGIPYIAGLYALVCQVKPDITPDLFWSTALDTGERQIIQEGGKTYTGKIINPVRLIQKLQ